MTLETRIPRPGIYSSVVCSLEKRNEDRRGREIERSVEPCDTARSLPSSRDYPFSVCENEAEEIDYRGQEFSMVSLVLMEKNKWRFPLKIEKYNVQ